MKTIPSSPASIPGAAPSDAGPTDRSRRLLVFNCHEPWVYQLEGLPREMDVVIGLGGRFKKTWDVQMRPEPAHARMVTLDRVLARPDPYYCIIAHNISDLMDVKHLPGPRLCVIHSTIEGRVREEQSHIAPEEFRTFFHRYLTLTGCHAVPCSLLKGTSWGITEDIVPFAVNPDHYLPHSGHVRAGLRVSNHIRNRKHILMWDFHERVFSGVPVKLVGHNPDIAHVRAAAGWDELKEIFSAHRFYIHTAHPDYEDGYNMATLEAMAAGLPVLGNRHGSSPIIDGVNGFLSDDPDELRMRAEQLLGDAELATRMGRAARDTVLERFSMSTFLKNFSNSIETARRKYRSRPLPR